MLRYWKGFEERSNWKSFEESLNLMPLLLITNLLEFACCVVLTVDWTVKLAWCLRVFPSMLAHTTALDTQLCSNAGSLREVREILVAFPASSGISQQLSCGISHRLRMPRVWELEGSLQVHTRSHSEFFLGNWDLNEHTFCICSTKVLFTRPIWTVICLTPIYFLQTICTEIVIPWGLFKIT